jgi:hypothetical protein
MVMAVDIAPPTGNGIIIPLSLRVKEPDSSGALNKNRRRLASLLHLGIRVPDIF